METVRWYQQNEWWWRKIGYTAFNIWHLYQQQYGRVCPLSQKNLITP
jgi:hypothetical protein